MADMEWTKQFEIRDLRMQGEGSDDGEQMLVCVRCNEVVFVVERRDTLWDQMMAAGSHACRPEKGR